MSSIKVRMALVSVADKTGLSELAECLARNGIGILSTGGTAKALREGGFDVTDVSEVTGSKEAFGGRVKTLDPRLLGAILFDRDSEVQQAELAELGSVPIDLVVVNFYDFARAAREGKDLAELVESIDIGGPTMVRSAAKNHRHVAVATSPAEYPGLIDALDESGGSVERKHAESLAARAFSVTADYERTISDAFAEIVGTEGGGVIGLRYGENPHQAGYATVGGKGLRMVGGPPFSYNNLQDAVFASRAVAEHERPTCAIVKHAIPCGVASADSIAEAYRKALAADPRSAYGGIVAGNVPLDKVALGEIKKTFYEVLVFPEYDDDAALALIDSKRLRSIEGLVGLAGDLDGRTLGELRLEEDRDVRSVTAGELTVAGKRKPTDSEIEELLFAWRVAKHVRSNAVVVCRDMMTVGIGAGQTSRVEAAEIAVMRAGAKGHDTKGSVAASDAFFPFADGIAPLASAGVTAVISPGGSRRDPEVIAAADEAGIAMVFTGVRHFSH